MPMMHVLHVSAYQFPMKVTRLFVGCETAADEMEQKLLNMQYCVWRTYEEAPERDVEETEAVQELVNQIMTVY